MAASGASAKGAFTDFPDYSKKNVGVHSVGRSNTFNSSKNLDAKFKDIPTRNDKRWGLGDSRSLMEICEMGFAKSAGRLGKELLTESREEAQIAMDELRHDIKGTWEQRDAVTSETLRQVKDQVHAIHQLALKPAKLDFSNADLGPLRDFLQKGDDERSNKQRDMMLRLEDRLSSIVSVVDDKVGAIQRQQDQLESVVMQQFREEMRQAQQGLQDLLRKSEQQADKMTSMLETLVSESGETSLAIHRAQEDNLRHHQGFAPVFNTLLTKLLTEQCVNVDFGTVVGRLTKVEAQFSLEFEGLLGEIAKIQQALQLDFAQASKVKDIGRGNGDSLVAIEGHPDDHDSDLVTVGNINSGRLTGKKSFFLAKAGIGTQPKRKRFRDFACQVVPTQTESCTQIDPEMLKEAKKAKHKARVSVRKSVAPAAKSNPQVFADAEAMKAKARAAAIEPKYNIMDYYYDTGKIQLIARSKSFEIFTLLIIGLNALWISIDTDNNDATVLLDAHPVFQIAENVFCTYFTWEVMIRLFALKYKRKALSDSWFVFDSTLVTIMIIETWLIPITMLAAGIRTSSGLGDASIFRLVRLVKLLRISRMARLLRSVPELMVLMKGVGAAARSVVVFLALWLIIIYVFGVLCRQLTDGDEIGNQYFRTVPEAMNTLLLDGLLPDNAPIVHAVTSASPILFPIWMIFILLACITLMYMLVGVLVDVVAVISCSEKESMTVGAVASELREAMENLGRDESSTMSRLEFQKLLMEPQIAKIVQGVGVDVVVLMDMSEIIFEDMEKSGHEMTFHTFCDIVLNMRGHNVATVKDIKEHLRVTKAMIKESTSGPLAKVQTELLQMKDLLKDVQALVRDDKDWDGSEASVDDGLPVIPDADPDEDPDGDGY